VFLTGGGAQLLLSRLQTFMPLDNIKLDPVFYSGRARELLEIIKNTKIFNLSEINSAPVYLRKSDAELKYI
jgi:Cft2 family RNA processing exonuclease